MRKALLRFPLEMARDLDDWVYERIGPARVLFIVSDPYGFACQAPVIRELLRSRAVSVRVTTDEPGKAESLAEALESAHDRTLFDALMVSHALARIRKWHYLVSTHLNGFYPVRRAIRVYMHHGPGFGILGEKLHVALKNDLFFGLSATEKQYLESLEAGIFDDKRAFVAIGFPKSDALVAGAYPREETLARLGLPDRPTILLTSHWRGPALLVELRSGAFRCLAEAYPDYNVVQTGHPWICQEHARAGVADGEQLPSELKAVEQRFPNARFVPTSDVEPLLAAADVMVGDHSSVMTTYSLLDKPILFYCPAGSKFVNNDFLDLYRSASHVFETTDELLGACASALRDPGEKSSGRARMRDAFYANRGTAAVAAARMLAKLGRIASPKSKRWTDLRETAVRANAATEGTQC